MNVYSFGSFEHEGEPCVGFEVEDHEGCENDAAPGPEEQVRRVFSSNGADRSKMEPESWDADAEESDEGGHEERGNSSGGARKSCMSEGRKGHGMRKRLMEEERDSGDDENNFSQVEAPKNGRNGKLNTITARAIMNMFGTSGRDRGSVGVKKLKRMKEVRELSKEKKRVVIRVLKNIVVKLMHTFFPNDSRVLLFDVVKEIGLPNEQAEVVVKYLALCKEGSHEKRMMRCVIMGNFDREIAVRMITKDVMETFQKRLDNMPLPKLALYLARKKKRDTQVDKVTIAAGKEVRPKDVFEESESEGEGESDSSEEDSEEDSEDGDDTTDVADLSSALQRQYKDPKLYSRLRSGNVRRVVRRASNDWKHLSAYGYLRKKVKRVARVSESTVRECVEFAYSDRFRQILAHGTKTVALHDKTHVELPKVQRTMSKRAITRHYLQWKSENSNTPSVGKTSFMTLLKRLTAGQQSMTTCVDYNITVLVYENWENLKKLIRSCLMDAYDRRCIENKLRAVIDFLKHGYSVHIDTNVDPAHLARRALVGDIDEEKERKREAEDTETGGSLNANGNEDDGGNEESDVRNEKKSCERGKSTAVNVVHDEASYTAVQSSVIEEEELYGGTDVMNEARRMEKMEERERKDILEKLEKIDKANCEAEPPQPAKERNIHCPTSQCDACLRPFQVIEEIRAMFNGVDNGCHQVLDDAASKFKLFMGHNLRCFVQGEALKEAWNMMDSAPIGTFAVVTCDYKMKFNPTFYRESSHEWYGKKGIAWHGSVITFRVDEDDSGHTLNEKYKWYRNVYLDHVCRNSTDQTAYSVSSIVELLMKKINTMYPAIKKVIFQSDNAGQYSNSLLPVILPFICKVYGIQLVSIVHSETQDGKGAADIHFATAMRHVIKYVEVYRKNVITPQDLVDALNHDGGMKGCIAELFDVNLSCEQYNLWWGAFKDSTKLAPIGRQNVIVYIHEISTDERIYSRCYKYWFSEPLLWVMEKGRSRCWKQKVARKGNTKNKTRSDNYVGGTSEKMENGVEEDRIHEIGTGEVRIEDEEEGSQSALDSSDEYFGDVVEDNVPFDERDMAVLFEGCMTGVKLIESADMRRSCFVPKKILCEEDRSNRPDGNDIASHRKNLNGNGKRTARLNCVDVNMSTDDEGNDYDENLVVRGRGGNYLCKKCDESFSSAKTAESHSSLCRTPQESCLFADQGVRMAKDLIDSNTIIVHTKAHDNPTFNAIYVTEETRMKTKFKPYWAVRPTKGMCMGNNFVGYYKEDIHALVDGGHSEKGAKQSAAQIQEILRTRHSQRYDIPSTYHINSCMKSYLSKGKRMSKLNPEQLLKASQRKPQVRMSARMAQCMEEVIRGDVNKPVKDVANAMRIALGIVEEQDPPDFPPMLQLTRKVYNLRSKIRAENK